MRSDESIECRASGNTVSQHGRDKPGDLRAMVIVLYIIPSDLSYCDSMDFWWVCTKGKMYVCVCLCVRIYVYYSKLTIYIQTEASMYLCRNV